MLRDSKGRFVSKRDINKTENKTNKKESEIMMNVKNNKEARMETLKANGICTDNFFNLNMNIPVGADVQVLINGVPYTITSDMIANKIMEEGYVYNAKTAGRYVCAQTFRMLTEKSYNYKTRKYEEGFDAYLRNNYGYMYCFGMMLDEVHRLSKIEKDKDPDFDKLNKFFTKDVVYETCRHYIYQLKKYVNNQPVRKCKGEPYVKLAKHGDVFNKDLYKRVYKPLEIALVAIKASQNYKMLEDALKEFMKLQCKLPYETPKCSEWKDAFKGLGGFKTLNNIIKHHGVVVQNYETGELLDRDGSISYVNSLIDTYNGAYWKYHELLKAAIKLNDFDLRKNIESQK